MGLQNLPKSCHDILNNIIIKDVMTTFGKILQTHGRAPLEYAI